MTAGPLPPKRKEGWFGVLVTAVLCGLFLWWWFLPEPVSAEAERDPLRWVGLARKNLGSADPTLPMRLEIILIAEALRARGETGPAAKIEADWLPPGWASRAQTSAAEAPPEPNAEAAGPPADLASVLTRLNEAATAFDILEIERGQEDLRAAAGVAAGLPDPLREQALWLVAARQARNGLSADAIFTRRKISGAGTGRPFPDWLVAEMFDGDIVAPVVAACSVLPASDPQVLALADRWRALARDRLTARDHPLLTRHGPTADASMPPADPDTATLWSAVEANRLGEAARLAGNDPSAQLAIARLLTLLAAPVPADDASEALPPAP
jgi:hypothetical protein